MVRLAILLIVVFCSPLRADDWAAARADGAILLMRHAEAPGTGDPAGFRLDDCATQRNLSAKGRRQASETGRALRANDIPVDLVASSQWCRCRDTATLVALGPVEDWPSLNSFFDDRSTARAQTARTLARLGSLPPGSRALLVTHQVNITALTGIVPRSGEIVIARLTPDGLAVTGRLTPR